MLARRAAGSMRDSQSLLEQLLAFAAKRITVADVHGMLGTAGDQRLGAMSSTWPSRNAAAALAELAAAVDEGVDVGQLMEQLLGYFRDCMAAAVGCPADSFLYASGTSSQQVAEAGKRLGLQTILAAMQILDQTLSRLRYSTPGPPPGRAGAGAIVSTGGIGRDRHAGSGSCTSGVPAVAAGTTIDRSGEGIVAVAGDIVSRG